MNGAEPWRFKVRGKGRLPWRWHYGVFILLLLWPQGVMGFLVNEWEGVESIGEVTQAVEEAKPGQPWVEPLSGIAFAWIPEGCFKRGTPPQVDGRDMDEGPVREVCLSGYWLGRQEVTQGQWRRVMRNNPAQFRKGDEYPVERVAWDDVENFIHKLNGHYPGKFTFRLPTEAEWEYACRNGGQRVTFAGGNDVDQLGWYKENSDSGSQPVGLRKPNRFGLLDMSGNVWEWVQDSYSVDGYAHSSRQNPLVVNGGNYRVIRGGGWSSPGKSLRCANRGFELFSAKRHDVGLRLARVIEVVGGKRQGLKDLGF